MKLTQIKLDLRAKFNGPVYLQLYRKLTPALDSQLDLRFGLKLRNQLDIDFGEQLDLNLKQKVHETTAN